MSLFVGIDFGCSNCRTAVLRTGALEVVSNRFVERPLPVILARADTGDEPGESPLPFRFTSLKQELGSNKTYETTVSSHSLEDKISEVLSQLREDVSGGLNRPVTEAVIGIPSFFTDKPRAALRDATLNSGFSGVRLYDEALAAVAGSSKRPDRGKFLVYALGSGVFAATVVLVEGDKLRVLAAEGQRYLGGTSFDELLIQHIVTRLDCGMDFVDRKTAALSLRKLADGVKAGLSRREEEVIDVSLSELFGHGGVATLEIKRSSFEHMIAEPVEFSIQLSRQAIGGAELGSSNIDAVLLAGKATSIPLIERQLLQAFSLPHVRVNDADVARGAAWFAGQVGEGNWKRKDHAVPSAPPPEPTGLTRSPESRPVSSPHQMGTWVGMFAPMLQAAESHWNSGKEFEAIQTLEKMMDDVRLYLGTLYHALGQRNFNEGNYVQAIDMLKMAVQHTPKGDDLDRVNKNYHEALNHRARQLATSGRWVEAKFTINQALELNRNCAGCRELKDYIIAMSAAAGKRGKRH
jgi:actin-like ATPase involved in cell morphogenesis